MRVLAIESSCDESAAAVIESGPRILASVVASQVPLHARFGGVVPEVASRAHLTRLLPVIHDALTRAHTSLAQLDAIAVVNTPGLVGSLLIGVTAAKTLAMVLGVPLVAVNHVEAHVYSVCLDRREPVFPCVALVVSGGHTSLYDCPAPLELELLGSTTDDAAGEAFDKVASILGLGYPGGPAIDQAARRGSTTAHRFPRSWLGPDSLDFSFSGIKTAVLYAVQGYGPKRRQTVALDEQARADFAASFQEAVVDVLVGKALRASDRRGRKRIAVGGGVAANTRLRERLAAEAAQCGCEAIFPAPRYCVDNAAMGALALEKLDAGRTDSLDLAAVGGLQRPG